MQRKDIKLISRYLIIVYLLALAWVISQPEHGNAYTESGVYQVIIGAVFGALSMVIGFHFNSQIDKDE